MFFSILMIIICLVLSQMRRLLFLKGIIQIILLLPIIDTNFLILGNAIVIFRLIMSTMT